MADYYIKLQQFFSAVKKLRNQDEETFETVIADEYSPRLLSFKEFDKESDIAVFDLKRVCRLAHDYVFYLFKLYLEYRGRQPFQTINLIRQEDTSLPIVLGNNETEQYLSFRSVPIPDKSNRKDWCWIIEASELNRTLEALELPKLSGTDQEIVLKNETISIDLQQGKRLCIRKAKKKVYFKLA